MVEITDCVKTTKNDYELITKIISRAIELVRFVHLNEPINRGSSLMDFDKCHTHGNPIDFKQLLESNDSDFYHDFFGIRNNINRENGMLENNFLPRCSK